MNRIYNLVFNRALMQFQVGSEHARRRRGGATAGPRPGAKALAMGALALALGAGPAAAQVAVDQLPTGADIRSGISAITSDGGAMTIEQIEQRAVIRWDDFDIGKGAVVEFMQQADDVVLNQILDVDASQILGTLEGEGTIFLMNPNGIVFGESAQVNVGGLVASTLAIDDDDFLTRDEIDMGNATAGTPASIVNEGAINAGQHGVALIGGHVSNSGQIVIGASAGVINLLGTKTATLSFGDNDRFSFAVQGALSDTVVGVAAVIENQGELDASGGGRVYINANTAAGIAGNAVNNSGVIRATDFSTGANGSVVLVGGVGDMALAGGEVETPGHLQVNTSGAVNLDGGDLDVAGLTVEAGSASIGSSLFLPGDLSITVGSGGISQEGAWMVGGTSTLDAGTGAITLTNAGNDFAGTVALAGGMVLIRDMNALALGTLQVDSLSAWSHGPLNLGRGTVSGNLAAASNGGAITQAGGLLVGGTSTLDAGTGAIMLTNAGNDFGGTVVATGIGIELVDAGNLTIAALNSGGPGAVRLVAGGTLTLPAMAIDTGAANLELVSGGALSTSGTLSGGNVRIQAGDDLALDHTIHGNRIELSTSGLFINNAGAGALTGDGSWQVYLATPLSGHVYAGLDSGNTALWNRAAFSAVSTQGNRYVFAYQPTVTFSSTDVSKTYGQTIDLSSAYMVSGLMEGVEGAYLGDTLASIATGSPSLHSAGADVTATVTGGPYVIDIAQGTLDLTGSGYAVDFDGTGRLTVDRAGLTITAGDAAKTYGEASGLGGYVVDGLLNSDAVDSADLASAGSVATANVGEYVITASNADGTGLSNYDITYVDGVLTVGRAGLTITAGNAGKTYGEVSGLGGYAVEGLLNEDAVDSVDLASPGSAASANVGDYVITASNADGTGLSNYDITYVDGVLTVGPAGLTITAGNAGKTYGEVSGLGGYVVEGLLNDDAVDSVDLASAGSVATANVGDYLITASNADGTGLSNYDITYVDGVLTVGRAGLTITAGNAGKTYGEVSGLGGYAVEGLINDDAVASVDLTSPGSAATANVGTYVITADNADGTGLSNYDITYADGVLTVGRAGLTITAGDAGKTYGEVSGLGGYVVEGLLNDDTVGTVDLGSAGSVATANVGDYIITVANADGTGLSNYDITYVDGVLTVGRAGLTITAGDAGKAYGEVSSLGGYSVDGLFNGDAVASVDLASAGSVATANVGDYVITAANADGTGLSNYDITYANGVLTVGRAGLTITAGDAGRTYGEVSGLGSYAVEGLLNEDTVDSVDLASAGSVATVNVGDYVITASNADGTGLSNYDITYIDGVLSVGRAGLTITAGDAGKTYGAVSSLGGYAVEGLINDDAVASVDLASPGSAATANVGTYVITTDNADGTGLSNYDITYVDGVLTVGRAGLTITAHDGSKPWGQVAQLDGYSVDGLLNADSVEQVTLDSEGVPALALPGDYAIVASEAVGTGLSNYNVNYVDGTLAVGDGGGAPPPGADVIARTTRAAAHHDGPLRGPHAEADAAAWEVVDGGILLPELCDPEATPPRDCLTRVDR